MYNCAVSRALGEPEVIPKTLTHSHKQGNWREGAREAGRCQAARRAQRQLATLTLGLIRISYFSLSFLLSLSLSLSLSHTHTHTHTGTHGTRTWRLLSSR